jgi:hypothetical protein
VVIFCDEFALASKAETPSAAACLDKVRKEKGWTMSSQAESIWYPTLDLCCSFLSKSNLILPKQRQEKPDENLILSTFLTGSGDELVAA